ncbi:phosphotransferase family protein [Oceanirhabdus sp. W0125-5]|uniref:phosphotransferase family protein n=1 Tax=Oceanirhabdus sp. W0125-5 TaxID=2999116 RepID=UPI0022F31E6D|nr:aminoglycoside phosphotransferase family protein [Oceanirhabdus sp. W0125-5]WBW99512.1 aminoglycoside phosphotransferase family protein [Oceanirhabdus sp. W0125-5]
MINYYKENINKIANKVVKNVSEIKEIGNHYLNRHLVYYIKNDTNEEYVLKIFFRKNKHNREIYCSKTLNEYNVKITEIADYGIFEDGVEWILYHYINGEILETIEEKINRESLKHLYVELGEELGKIHSSMTFNSMGDWNRDLIFEKTHDNFIDQFNEDADIFIKKVYERNISEEELLVKAYNTLKENTSILQNIVEITLCHNDYGSRNIMVSKDCGTYFLKSIIDFEMCCPWDRDMELLSYYYELRKKDSILANCFRNGYEKHLKIDDNRINKKQKLYYLYLGLSICCWAKERDPDYYLVGLRYINENIDTKKS